MARQHKEMGNNWWGVGLLGASALILGTWGWLLASPGLGLPEALYRSVQLFALEMAEEAHSVPLEIAKWMAVFSTMATVGTILFALFQGQCRRLRAQRSRGHLVIVGAGPEVFELASRNASVRPTVVVGELDANHAAQLAAAGVTTPWGLSDLQFAKVLRDAQDIVVSGHDGIATHKLLTQVTAANQNVETVAVFDSPHIAQLTQQPGAKCVSRATQVALETLQQCPPFPAHAAVPDPVVVGDGEIAAELTRRIITGWQHDGGRPRVHCLTDRPAWTHDLVAEPPRAAYASTWPLTSPYARPQSRSSCSTSLPHMWHWWWIGCRIATG